MISFRGAAQEATNLPGRQGRFTSLVPRYVLTIVFRMPGDESQNINRTLQENFIVKQEATTVSLLVISERYFII